jgi:hypothetical protein
VVFVFGHFAIRLQGCPQTPAPDCGFRCSPVCRPMLTRLQPDGFEPGNNDCTRHARTCFGPRRLSEPQMFTGAAPCGCPAIKPGVVKAAGALGRFCSALRSRARSVRRRRRGGSRRLSGSRQGGEPCASW